MFEMSLDALAGSCELAAHTFEVGSEIGGIDFALNAQPREFFAA